jgi:hypothetical protein
MNHTTRSPVTASLRAGPEVPCITWYEPESLMRRADDYMLRGDCAGSSLSASKQPNRGQKAARRPGVWQRLFRQALGRRPARPELAA